mgnify:FL=1
MTPEMTWTNIHIDHIRPLSSFDLSDHDAFLDCCNYTNLQPLLAEDNLNKSDKWSDEDTAFWEEHIRGKVRGKEFMQIYLPREMSRYIKKENGNEQAAEEESASEGV